MNMTQMVTFCFTNPSIMTIMVISRMVELLFDAMKRVRTYLKHIILMVNV